MNNERAMKRKDGYSLVELMAVTAVIGLLAAVIVVRLSDGKDAANIAACHTYKGNVEVQAELWQYNTGAWPAANLATIGANSDYFPEGIPVCPVDGSAYTIDPATGRVVGHAH